MCGQSVLPANYLASGTGSPIKSGVQTYLLFTQYTGSLGRHQFKLSTRGCQILARIGSDRTQMGQIRGFFKTDYQSILAGRQNDLKTDMKKSRICPIWGQTDTLWSQTYHPCSVLTLSRDVRFSSYFSSPIPGSSSLPNYF